MTGVDDARIWGRCDVLETTPVVTASSSSVADRLARDAANQAARCRDRS